MTKTKIAAITGIPVEKLGYKIQKTFVGVGFAALGVWLVRLGSTSPPSTWLAGGGAALCVFGGVTACGELVLAPFKKLGQAIVDLYKQIKG